MHYTAKSRKLFNASLMDNMDFDEAAESAVEKRKFLLNRVIGKKILPENSDDEEEKEEASV